MIVDVLDLRPVAGPNRSPLYLESSYRGMHVELRYDGGGWHWSFYDQASPDPELAVARGWKQSYVAAEKELIEYIDGYALTVSSGDSSSARSDARPKPQTESR